MVRRQTMASLYTAFSEIKTEREFDDFLRDLCTPAEIAALSERWNIARELSQKQLSQQAVAKKLNVSVATVSRVARFLNDEPFGGYRLILSRIYHA